MMKRILVTLTSLLVLSAVVFAGYDQPITFEQLPVKAQQFIKKHFPDKKIALAKVEKEIIGRSYDVIFTNGDKLEFNKKGEWTEITCRSGAVPTTIIPAPILNYVKKNYPNVRIMEIERKSNYYEINLSNRFEIKFNKNFQVIEIDR